MDHGREECRQRAPLGLQVRAGKRRTWCCISHAVWTMKVLTWLLQSFDFILVGSYWLVSRREEVWCGMQVAKLSVRVLIQAGLRALLTALKRAAALWQGCVERECWAVQEMRATPELMISKGSPILKGIEFCYLLHEPGGGFWAA